MFKSRLKTKNLFRRASSVQVNDHDHDHGQSPQASSPSEVQPESPQSRSSPAPSPTTTKPPKKSRSFSSLRDRRRKSVAAPALPTDTTDRVDIAATAKKDQDAPATEASESIKSAEGTLLDSSITSLPALPPHTIPEAPEVVIEEATPGSPTPIDPLDARVAEQHPPVTPERRIHSVADLESFALASDRKQSLVARADIDIIKALLQDEHLATAALTQKAPSLHRGLTTASETTALNASMLSRKVWVKRPNAAATIVLIREDDMVDEAKEAILRKYGNQLGRHFDAPDLTIRILTRDQPGERVLSPDEPLCRTLDSYYPGGQTVDEALLIDVPTRRTPRPSPRAHNHHTHQTHNSHHYYDEGSARPHESATDYFPPMPPISLGQPSPLLTSNSHDSHTHEARKSHAAHERAMSVLNTGQVPPLPSPGAVGRRAHLAKQHGRPNHPRQHTSSPTTLSSAVASRANRPRLDSTTSTEKHPQLGPPIAALPTPPAPDSKAGVPVSTQQPGTNPPTPRVASPRPGGRPKKTRQRQKDEGPTASLLPPGILDTSVPPINVLIVEDNMINMRLLEQFVRRLGVRWQTAVNGREAVTKWRQGGFHLVLMDIQLPIMSGLEATKEIRRLERVNNIGVFSSASSSAPELDTEDVGENGDKVIKPEDKLFEEGYSRLFKSPVIIVALTASNLQSDRHEALGAGCNDFLTKPVNFVWFERKVKEWGCMQALIDFDGWRKWKDFAEANGLKDPSKPAGAPVKPARKALKAEAAKKNPEDKVPITATGEAPKVPDPKTLDNSGLEKVGSEKKPDTKESTTPTPAETANETKGAKLQKEDSTDTVVHEPIDGSER